MSWYALSDIHGDYEAFETAWAQIPATAMVYFVGDYIDGGAGSYRVLQAIYELAQAAPERRIVLLGNHEASFLDFLFGHDELDWLSQDIAFRTVKSFFTAAQWQEMQPQLAASPESARQVICQALLKEHDKLLHWLNEQPRLVDLPNQIIVHAGVDEEMGEEWWKSGTSDETLVGKYPATTGSFYKDVIAGHVSSAEVAQDPRYFGHIYWDRQSHFYIDGTTTMTYVVPVLYYDGAGYWEVRANGKKRLK